MKLHQLLTTLWGDRDHQRHHGIKALARPAILLPASRPGGNARAAGGVPSGRAAPRGVFHFGCCRCHLAFVLMWLAALPAQAQFFTNVSFFSGNIALNGDTADFIQADGVSAKPGVCVANDPSGLDESPLNAGNTRDAQNHPTGFNQRRIMTAFDPNLNGGTIYLGIDLPGGSGADSGSKTIHGFPGNANPNFFDGVVGQDGGGNGFGRGKIVPFDADGNGEADTIGRRGDERDLYRCADAVLGDTLDVVWCRDGAGMTDNPRSVSGERLGVVENYVAAIVFGNGQVFSVELYQDARTPAGVAQLRTLAFPAAPFGARASTATGGSGAVLGFDVEFAITNVNLAVPDLDARLRQIVLVYSASNRSGPGGSGDCNLMECLYAAPAPLKLVQAYSPGPVMPGGWVTFTGSVRNPNEVALAQVTVVNDWPAPNTPVLGPITLAAGETRTFTNRYLVPPDYTNGSITGTLTAQADVGHEAPMLTTASATCAVIARPCFTGLRPLGTGAMELTFAGPNAASYIVLATTDVTQPLAEWMELGATTPIGGGLYQFIDVDATQQPSRFYQLRCP